MAFFKKLRVSLSRHESTVGTLLADPEVTIISVEDCAEADHAMILAQARNAQRVGKRISVTTKRSLRAKKADGMRLGNQTNLPEAQRLGAEANRRRAQRRAQEYAPVIAQINPNGTRTKAEIADALNNLDRRTDRGMPWKPGNIRRLLDDVKKLKLHAVELTFEERQLIDPLWGAFA